MNNDFQAPFMTIRALARAGFLPETALRRLAAQKRLPGFHAGKKFLINTAMLRAMISDPESVLNSGGR